MIRASAASDPNSAAGGEPGPSPPAVLHPQPFLDSSEVEGPAVAPSFTHAPPVHPKPVAQSSLVAQVAAHAAALQWYGEHAVSVPSASSTVSLSLHVASPSVQRDDDGLHCGPGLGRGPLAFPRRSISSD